MSKKFKQVDKNFILALILTSALLLFAAAVNLIACPVASELETLKNGMNGKLGQPIEDVAGYALILEGLGYGIGSISLALVKLFFVWFPLLLGGYIFSFAWIAKLVYAMSNRRIILYRVLMGVSFSGQIVMLLYDLIMITFGGWLFTIGLVSSIGVFFIIFLGIRGTYTKTIFK